jgi:hypothetical protein
LHANHCAQIIGRDVTPVFQLRVEGSKFLSTFPLSGILIYLVLAAQFGSFRDPFIILADGLRRC